ncbi:putative polygalacturonase [Senna tora]|uniref:Putative polygalacturonase n=1 Tax=Senna tora TaxID=362788 RepID=A0A834TSA4_9FABA|nr:putative polygalacturonase [Senna tora]
MAKRFLLLVPLVFFTFIQSNFATSQPFSPLPITVSVTDYGAAGDGVQYDTRAIQSAINSCPTGGPCQVTFPAPGKYLTATVFLKSGVVLNVEPGATILGGTNQEDYPRDPSRWYVVVAENATEVGIGGGGVVDGQAMEFVVRKDVRKNVMVSWNQTGACLGDECRPRLVGFLDCTNVRISNITLHEPAYWCANTSAAMQPFEVTDYIPHTEFNRRGDQECGTSQAFEGDDINEVSLEMAQEMLNMPTTEPNEELFDDEEFDALIGNDIEDPQSGVKYEDEDFDDNSDVDADGIQPIRYFVPTEAQSLCNVPPNPYDDEWSAGGNEVWK